MTQHFSTKLSKIYLLYGVLFVDFLKLESFDLKSVHTLVMLCCRYGQNLYASNFAVFSSSRGVEQWFNESHYYTYDNDTCAEHLIHPATNEYVVCGHYTQVTDVMLRTNTQSFSRWEIIQRVTYKALQPLQSSYEFVILT